MKWNNTSVTEHKRSSLQIDVERIEESDRTASGFLRKWVVADKKTFSCSWSEVPALAANTVDGKWGGQDIETFHATTPGVFTLTIVQSHRTDTYNVVFKSFDKEVVKRTGQADRWNINVSLEEV